MRFVMIIFLANLALAGDFLKAPKAFEEKGLKVEIDGEILLRYEKQKTNIHSLKRPAKGSEGSLNIRVQ